LKILLLPVTTEFFHFEKKCQNSFFLLKSEHELPETFDTSQVSNKKTHLNILSAGIIASKEETLLNLLSRELYSEIIAGLPLEMTNEDTVPPSDAKVVIKAANNPYIINFYDAYITSQND
jgi:hypothetical protein